MQGHPCAGASPRLASGLHGAVDIELLNALERALTPEHVADLLVTAQGKADIARNRLC